MAFSILLGTFARFTGSSIIKGATLMRKIGMLFVITLFAFALAACNKETTTTSVDTYDYTQLAFPDFSAINPVRYTAINEMDMEYLGWQDFGTTGEIESHPWPMMTYTYQMYSYFIRTDLQHFYVDVPIPEDIADLPAWVADVTQNGRRVIWFSMMASTLPDAITLLDTETLASENGIQTFVRAEYRVCVGDTQTDWIIYFMDVEGIFSSYAVRVNEFYDTVLSTSDFIVQSYQLKAPSM
jgi:hypothetical protein